LGTSRLIALLRNLSSQSQLKVFFIRLGMTEYTIHVIANYHSLLQQLPMCLVYLSTVHHFKCNIRRMYSHLQLEEYLKIHLPA
jgi:hypothetical protein